MLPVLLRSRHVLRARAISNVARSTVIPQLNLRKLGISSRSRQEVITVTEEVKEEYEEETAFKAGRGSDAVAKTLVHRKIPLTCPGCGAPSQKIEPGSAGYYGEKYNREKGERKKQEDAVFVAALARGGFQGTEINLERPAPDKGTPICDRCHQLLYQSAGRSIIHPSTESIRSIIDESPHRRNHIYHVLDAADFPMSLIPNLTSALRLPRLRTRNRRSKSMHYIRDRVAEISFIITRSDLLAPKKEQVDALLPYIQEVLRDALGRSGRSVRLGNVRLVSSKRGWWTKHVKEEIFNRGGAGWMVGKVNVGKSALVEVVFPKGRMNDVNIVKLRADAVQAVGQQADAFQSVEGAAPDAADVVNATDAADADVDLSKTIRPFAGSDIDPSFEIDSDSTIHASAADIIEADETIEVKDDIQPTESEETTQNMEPGEVADNDGIIEDATEAMETPNIAEAAETEDSTKRWSMTKIRDDTDFTFDESELALLPPAQPEVQYPIMPIVSALPGTTASPIRLPFGNGKGELIDLPGITRSNLESFVTEQHRKEMIMTHRIVPEQKVIKPGQSLLLGGLIRITPKTDELVFMMYGFVPEAMRPHVTSTAKATAVQTGMFAETGEAYEGHVSSSATDAAKLSIKSAGSFKLRWDVTRQRAGPVTSKVAGKQKPETLPYIVYGLDLLIEGVGWVEIVAQVRRRAVEQSKHENPPNAFENEPRREPDGHLPEIEVFSPRGRFVGVRRPMNGWLLGGPKKTPVHLQRARPRHSMSYHRRMAGGRAGSARVMMSKDT